MYPHYSVALGFDILNITFVFDGKDYVGPRVTLTINYTRYKGEKK